MRENNITIEEYTRRYARDYCNGDIEEAKNHAVVKEVMQEKREERGAGDEAGKRC